MLRAVVLACFAVLALPLPACAQGKGDRQHRLTEHDVEFAKSLARFRFFDLSLDVLATVKAGRLDTELEGTVLYTEADILRRQSQGLGDDAERLEVQSRAIEMLADWGKAGSALVFHPMRTQALDALWQLQRERGQLRVRQAAAEGDSARAGSLRELAGKDYDEGVKTLVLLQREYEKQAEQAASEGSTDRAAELTELAALTIYSRGLVLLDWADVEPDPAFRLEEAIEALTDFQWQLEEEKLTQYYALHYVGVAQRKLGQVEDARSSQAEVLERGQWYWDNMRVDPEGGARNEAVAPYVSVLLDRAWCELAMLDLAAGESESAMKVVDSMFAAHDKGKEPFTVEAHEVLLGLADALAAAGRSGKAGEVIKFVADKAPPGSAVADRARQRLGEMVSATGGADESASVLMAAASGLFGDRRFADAAFTWGRATAAMHDDSERREHLFDAWLGMANALFEERRFLEAALAYEHALDAAVAFDEGEDPQKAAAYGMYKAWDRRHKETASAFDKSQRDTASDKLIKMGVGEDLQFLKAKEVFDDAVMARPQDPARYLEALEELRSVPSTAPNTERSLVYAARALAGAGQLDEALAAFDELLARTADPALAPVNANARTRREVALGECLYYKADLLLSLEPPRPADALSTLAAFEEKLPGQTGLIESVKYARITAHALRVEVEPCRAAFDDLKAFKADSKYLGPAAFRVSDVLFKASNAAREQGDGVTADALLLSAADFMWLHCEAAGFSSFANIVNSGSWYARVGRPDLAQRSLQKALDEFADDPAVPVEQKDTARLGLGNAFNQLKEFNRGRPYWQDLLKRQARNPAVMAGAARCFGGWLELAADGTTVVEVPGSGDYADARSLWTDLAQGAAARKYQREWWEAKLNAVYAIYREASLPGTANSARLAEARKIIDSMRALTPNYDADTVANLPPEAQYQPLLKPYFKYLEKVLQPR